MQDRDRGSDRRTARLTVECAVALIGVACVVTAVLAHQRWLDRHFLPSFFVPVTTTCFAKLSFASRSACSAYCSCCSSGHESDGLSRAARPAL